MKTNKLLTTYFTILILFSSCFIFTHCTDQKDYSVYQRELGMVDSVRKAYNLSPGDSSISDFFLKEVRYKKFGVSIYRLEDSINRHYLFGILKNETSLRIFPLIDSRLLEEKKTSNEDTT